jgi:hypothetical protein
MSEEQTQENALEHDADIQKQPVTFGQVFHRLSYCFTAALFITAILVTIYYITTAAKGEFHSDCTDTIYWANATYESGHMLSADFSYACLLPFGGSLLMLPFFPFFGLSMTTHVLGMLLFFVIFTVFLCLMLHEMHWDIRSICTAGFVVLGILMCSKKTREMFWGHTIYYSLGVLFLIMGTYFYFRFKNLADRAKQLKKENTFTGGVYAHMAVTAVLLLLLLMLSATDGVSALSIFGLPFLAALVAVPVVDSSTPLFCKKNLFVYGQVVLFGIMIGLGLLLGAAWAGDITAGYESAYSKYAAQNTWQEHVQGLPMAWLTLFGVQDLQGEPLTTLESVENIFHIFGALLVAILPIAATCFYNRYPANEDGNNIRIWIWIHWAVTTIIMLGYVCGLLSAANWRLLPVLCTGLLVSVMFIHWAVCTCRPGLRVVGLLGVFVAVLAFLSLSYVADMPKDSYKNNQLFELADALEEEGCTYGYATFWRSNAITVITGSEVRVRTVEVSDTGVTTRSYQTQRNWYEDQPGQDEYFLLLDAGEYKTLSGGENTLLQETSSIRDIQLENGTVFYLLFFDHNIF